MSSHSNGHFSAKHPPDTKVAASVRKAVQEKLADRTITCQAAHSLADSLQVPPHEIGVAIDLQEARLLKCQLGLFGYGKGQKKVKPAKSIMPDVRNDIEAALVNDYLPCSEAWRIADHHSVSRFSIANACEMLGVRIKPCQLGAF